MIKQSRIWQFRLDPSDIGESEHWERQEFTQTIEIPGILQAQGYGDKINRVNRLFIDNNTKKATFLNVTYAERYVLFGRRTNRSL